MDRIFTESYIKTICETRNISAAAEILGISQPALSAYLKKLEEHIGAALFDRSKKPIELTEAGRLYLEYTEKAEALSREFMQRISDIENLKSGHLTVGGAGFFNITYIPGAVAEFAAEYPGIDVRIIDARVPEISAEALKGKIDLFITPTADDPDRFCYEKLFEERVFICVPKEWSVNKELGRKKKGGFAVLEAQDFEKLKSCTFVLLRRDQHIGRKMNDIFKRYGFEPAHSVSAEQMLTSLALTKAGVGVSLITESTLESSGIKDSLEIYLADEDICTREMFAAYPHNKYISKATAEFVRILKNRKLI